MISMLLAAVLATPGASAPPSAAPPTAETDGPVVELRAPLFSAAFSEAPVASVDGEPIRLRELTDVLGEAHAGHGAPGTARTSEQDVSKILERLVTLRIVAAEARNMGIHELPELAKAFAENRSRVARQIVRDRATARVEPDPKEVEALVRELTRELKLDAVFFSEPKEAEALRKAVVAGGSFAALSSEAITAEKAKRGSLGDWVRPVALLPAVRGAVEGLEKGKVARAVVVTPKGAAVVFLEDERFATDPLALAEAEQTSRGNRRQAETVKYYQALKKKLATVDSALLAQADFNSAKAYRARTKDARVLARIKGAPSVKVSDLAAAMGKQFFHGVERRADKKELTGMKEDFFNVLLFDRLLDREAELQGIAATTEFEDRVGEFERGQLFGKFVERVLVPDVDVKEDEVLARYEAKKASYTTPAMVTLEALAFEDAKASKTALEKAQGGADFRWLAENADGLIPAEKRSLAFGSRPVALGGLPEGVARSLRGAHGGDYRVHREGDQHYVLHVVSEIPEAVRPYPEVRQELAKVVFAEKLEAALQEYVTKLRTMHDVKVYATRIGT